MGVAVQDGLVAGSDEITQPGGECGIAGDIAAMMMVRDDEEGDARDAEARRVAARMEVTESRVRGETSWMLTTRERGTIADCGLRNADWPEIAWKTWALFTVRHCTRAYEEKADGGEGDGHGQQASQSP